MLLNIEIFVKLLKFEIVLSNMILRDKDKEGFHQVWYKYNPNFSTSQNNMWILSGNNGPEFIRTENKKFTNRVTISSSDWIHDYCPVFQIGKFAVFEYLMPEYTEGTGSIEERLDESINALEKMEENLVKGEWNGIIENSRAVWELLRNQEEEIRDLLVGDGYTEQAFDDFNKSINQLFKYSSKFMHRLDVNKKDIMP